MALQDSGKLFHLHSVRVLSGEVRQLDTRGHNYEAFHSTAVCDRPVIRNNIISVMTTGMFYQ